MSSPTAQFPKVLYQVDDNAASSSSTDSTSGLFIRFYPECLSVKSPPTLQYKASKAEVGAHEAVAVASLLFQLASAFSSHARAHSNVLSNEQLHIGSDELRWVQQFSGRTEWHPYR